MSTTDLRDKRVCSDYGGLGRTIPKFLHFLKEQDPEKFKRAMDEAPSEFRTQDGEFNEVMEMDVLWLADETFWWFHETIWHLMEELAPEGYHFCDRASPEAEHIVYYGYFKDGSWPRPT